MAVSKEDRADYEQGRSDRNMGVVETVFRDTLVQNPGTDAYYKGREGRELDDDKKK